MITYWILNLFESLKFSIVSAIPTIEAPVWLTAHLPDIMVKIAGFNYYLPVLDAMLVIIGCITLTLGYKILKVMAGIINIDLDK